MGHAAAGPRLRLDLLVAGLKAGEKGDRLSVAVDRQDVVALALVLVDQVIGLAEVAPPAPTPPFVPELALDELQPELLALGAVVRDQGEAVRDAAVEVPPAPEAAKAETLRREDDRHAVRPGQPQGVLEAEVGGERQGERAEQTDCRGTAGQDDLIDRQCRDADGAYEAEAIEELGPPRPDRRGDHRGLRHALRVPAMVGGGAAVEGGSELQAHLSTFQVKVEPANLRQARDTGHTPKPCQVLPCSLA